MRTTILMLGVGILAGCRSTYTYQPEVNASATIDNHVAAFYALPPAAPQGDLRIASFGTGKVRFSEGEPPRRAMHVRMMISNNSDKPWTVDTREQLGIIRGGGQSRPAFVTSTAGSPPTLAIAPGTKQKIDLFYPLPERMQSDDTIPEFDVVWKVTTGNETLAERTPFERLELEPRQAAFYDPWFDYGFGWGPYGWYDPDWYGYTFMGPSPAVRVSSPAQPVVVSAPRWRAPLHPSDNHVTKR